MPVTTAYLKSLLGCLKGTSTCPNQRPQMSPSSRWALGVTGAPAPSAMPAGHLTSTWGASSLLQRVVYKFCHCDVINASRKHLLQNTSNTCLH